MLDNHFWQTGLTRCYEANEKCKTKDHYSTASRKTFWKELNRSWLGGSFVTCYDDTTLWEEPSSFESPLSYKFEKSTMLFLYSFRTIFEGIQSFWDENFQKTLFFIVCQLTTHFIHQTWRIQSKILEKSPERQKDRSLESG